MCRVPALGRDAHRYCIRAGPPDQRKSHTAGMGFLRECVKSGTGILPVAFRGIGILPMIHGLEAHAT